MKNKTIYISVPSIEDLEILETIKNAFYSAKNPDRIFFGIALLDKTDDIYNKIKNMPWKENISVDYKKLDKNSIPYMGTGNGRHRAAQMYSGQDFMLQIDSHTMFLDSWDEVLIDLFTEFEYQYGSDNFIFTGYLPSYKYNEDKKRVSIRTKMYYPYYLPNKFFLNKIPCWDILDIDNKVKDKFVPCVKFNGNFVFGNKKFINNPGRYKEAIFYDEETIQSINLIGNDMAMVFINIDNFPLHHLYTDDINEYGGGREYFTGMFGSDAQNIFSNRSVDNYISYIKNPINKEFVKKYEKYSRVHSTKGAIIEKYIPKSFTVQD